MSKRQIRKVVLFALKCIFWFTAIYALVVFSIILGACAGVV